MLVVGSRGLGGFVGLLLGSISLRVAARAGCPVAIIRDEISTDSRPVVVGVNDSPAADLAVGMAFGEAAARGCGLLAIRAWKPPAPPWRSDVWPLIMDVDEIETAERRLLTDAVAGWRVKYPDVPVDVHLVPTGAARAVVDASRGAAARRGWQS